MLWEAFFNIFLHLTRCAVRVKLSEIHEITVEKTLKCWKSNASSIFVYLNRIDTFSMLMALILFLDWMSFAICKKVKSVWKDFAFFDQLESLKTCRGKVRKSRSSIFCFSCTSSCSLVERVNENMWIVAVAFLRERLESESGSRERLGPTWLRRW